MQPRPTGGSRRRKKIMRKAIGLVVALVLIPILTSCRPTSSQTVVVYVSEDQVFSEPILKDFERDTGITVKSIFDTEESKSTGVTNRLIAEKDNPQADVYWANEPVRADALKQRGVSSAYDSPSAEGIAALFTIWGDDRAKTFMNDIKRNGVKMTTSNGESTDFVATGDVDFSLVDSDNAVNTKKQGKPVEIIYPDQDPNGLGVLILPNAVALIKAAPHAENGKRLIDYLLSKETERKLAFADCAQIPLHSGVEIPPEIRRIEDTKTMRVGYADLARKMEDIQPFLKEWAGQ